MPELNVATSVDDLGVLATPTSSDYVLVPRNGEIFRVLVGDLPGGSGTQTSTFEAVADFEAWIAGGGTAPNGTYVFANGAPFYADDTFSGLPDKPGWRIAGVATLAHFDVNGADIGSDTYYHAVPTVDEYLAIQEAFNFCVANGYDLIGDTSRVYGFATELNWGSTATVTPKGGAKLDDCHLTWIGAADTPIDKTDPDPDNWAWTTNPAALRVGNRAGDTDKYRVRLGPNVRVDGQRLKNCIQFRGLEDVDIECFAVRGLDYEALIGVQGNNSAATTDCKIKVRGWHYAYEENSSGVFGADDGTGHYGQTGRTSSGVVVYSSDVFVEPHLARGKHNLIIGESYGATVTPISKVYSGPDRTAGVNAMIITPGANRYTWIGGDIQDGGLRVMSGNGKIIGLTLAQYSHNMITLVASASGETFANFTLASCRFSSGAAEVVLETIGSGTWGAFAGTFYGNKNGNGTDMTIQGRKFSIGGVVDPFLTFADFVTAVGTHGWSPAGGTTVTIGGLSWQKIPAGHVLYGTDPISALPGWMPSGAATPDHCAHNAVPGTTDMTAAVQEISDFVAASPDTRLVTFLPVDYFMSDTWTIDASRVNVEFIPGARITRTGDYGDTLHILSSAGAATRLSHISLENVLFEAQAAMTTGAHIKAESVIYMEIEGTFLNGFKTFDFEGVQASRVKSTIKSGAYYTTSTVTGSMFAHVKHNASYETTELLFDQPNWTRTGSLNTPIEQGIRIEGADGVWVDGGHIFGAKYITFLTPGSATDQLQGVIFNGVWLDQNCDYHVYITGTSTGGFGDFRFNGCRGLNAAVKSVYVAGSATDLSDVEFNGGDWSITSAGTHVFDFLHGKNIKLNGASPMSSQAMAGGSIGVNVGGNVRGFSMTGGECGTSSASGNLAQGIVLGSASQDANIAGVRFKNCDQEISVPSAMQGGSKITGCSTIRSGAGDVVGAATIALNPVRDNFDIITTAASIADIQGGWDGRKVLIRSNGVSTTFKYNTGAAGTKILMNSAADVVVASGKFVALTYSSEAGAWFLQE